MRRVQVIDLAFPGRPAFDSAFSRALLDRVACGAAPETFRLYRPDDVLAFSGFDVRSDGFDAAVAAARAAGFAPALRLAGGRAAVFHGETLAFAWTVPATDARDGIRARFAEAAGWMAAALRRIGVDARVGEVPGEYCPGEWSVNAGGARKLMGVGQRVIRGAAHVGGVVVVRDAARVRAALEPVYAAMGVAWRPETAGAVEDEVPGATRETVAAALLAELGARFDVTQSDRAALDPVIEASATLESRFAIGPGAEAGPALAGGGKIAIERGAAR